ncbi:FecR family protein [Lacibacter cauensis]|uniref:FecR family protein n=1 Tax=Lacibacter cauensis TaxID=510947 RepID=A0A562SB90_9BACT|nr:FecR family protein [Lacibacter cauensis]TWI77936.1 FecR family protein [Lacibacter cauensis]
MKATSYSDRDQPAYRIAYLIAGYIRNTLTKTEHTELDDWVNESDHNMQLFEELTDEENIKANLAKMDLVLVDQHWQEVNNKLAQAENEYRKKQKRTVWSMAAAIVIIISGAVLFLLLVKSKPEQTTVMNADSLQLVPGSNKATLTLADGSVVDLSTAKNGVIDSNLVSHANKPADGELVYEAKNNGPVSALHALSTPVGGQYKVVLADGSKVWLNASTTLKYPAAFNGKERRVEVNGEAYFEIAKNEQQPFRVVLPDSSVVTVTGTQFNVMCYSTATQNEVTLVEGRVAVAHKGQTQNMEPGTQTAVSANGLVKYTGVDIEAITGWKNGLFVFHDASIETIMTQVERWYGAKVVYRAKTKQLLNAEILRSEPLPKLLGLLELNGYVHFKIENKIIYVLP